jgi:transposase
LPLTVDLAKLVCELVFADAKGRIIERMRLSRAAFATCLDNRPPPRVVMEACGSTHYWAPRFERPGHTEVLLPAQHVRPYVRRNKTDRTDTAGLLEDDRSADIRPVPIKTPEQQGAQGLHRIREHHKVNRTAAINMLRGLLREFGTRLTYGHSKSSVSSRKETNRDGCLDIVPDCATAASSSKEACWKASKAASHATATGADQQCCS